MRDWLIAIRCVVLAALQNLGRLLLILVAMPLTVLWRIYDRFRARRARRAAWSGSPGRRPRILFICGTINQTTQLHQIALELPEYDHAFSWYYANGPLDLFRRLRLLESTALGYKLRARCLEYLERHSLPLDLGGTRANYDLVLTCCDLAVPNNVRQATVVLVQEGMTDPEDMFFQLVKRLHLPVWLAVSSSTTGLSDAYRWFCVASEGYRRLFERKGVRPEKLLVTGIPNFDDCGRYTRNDFPHRGYVLVCSSDLRETARYENRSRFIAQVLRIADGRQVIWKLHPNENVRRARAEFARQAPGALVYESGSAEEMIANCDVLITQYSSTAYVG